MSDMMRVPAWLKEKSKKKLSVSNAEKDLKADRLGNIAAAQAMVRDKTPSPYKEQAHNTVIDRMLAETERKKLALKLRKEQK